MNPADQDLIDDLRVSEVLYRKRGAFEAAVQCQRSADFIEGGGHPGTTFCSWFDRGIDRRPYFSEHDGMLGIHLPNKLWFIMPKDVQFELWVILTMTLGMTSADLHDFGHQIYLEETRNKEPSP